jgi:hypothetical protein
VRLVNLKTSEFREGIASIPLSIVSHDSPLFGWWSVRGLLDSEVKMNVAVQWKGGSSLIDVDALALQPIPAELIC